MKNKARRFLREIVYLSILFLTAGAVLAGCGKSPIGINNNRLMPCPSSPNCVSSQETKASHSVEPIRYTVSRKQAKDAVISILEDFPRTRVATIHDNYIHAEFRSRIFSFVDDMEFLFDEDAPLIDIRSASRVGYSDMGVNRKRVEAFRERFFLVCPINPDMEIAR